MRIIVFRMNGFNSLAVHTDVHELVRELAFRERTSMTNIVRRAVTLYSESKYGAIAADLADERQVVLR